MRISIVTAAFRPALMDRVWESIKKQTHTEWEWVIVNDGQQGIRDWYNKSKEEGKFPEGKVWMVDLEISRGRFGLSARNAGAVACRYDNIIYLDDDNEWREDHLALLVQFKEETGKHPFCWMDIRGKKEGSTFQKFKRTGFSKQGIDLGCLLWTREMILTHGGLFKDERQVTFDFCAMERVYTALGPDAFVCTDLPTLIFHHKRY